MSNDNDGSWELGGSTIPYKLNWNDLIIHYVDRCGKYYALSHIHRRYAPIYVSWVKNLHSIMLPYLDERYQKDMLHSIKVINKKYDTLKSSRDWASKFSVQHKIDLHFMMFQNLMRVIKREGFLQTKGVTINLAKTQ